MNRSKTPRELEADCKQALGSTNPDDHLRDIRAKKPSLVDADYEWVLHNKKFQKWIDKRNKSQLLWISGSRMGDNTMMSIYLIRELREMKKSTVLFFFVDSREEERKSAVDILRGLILLLVKAPPSLLQRHLIKEFEYQRKDLFNSKYSLMTLWKFFATMARDQETGDLIIIIDALDVCAEESLRSFLRKICDFFNQDYYTSKNFNQKPKRSELNNSIKLIVLSREYPAHLTESLSRFPRIKLRPMVRSDVPLVLKTLAI